MKKYIILFVFAMVCSVCQGQRLTLSSELTVFNDDPAIPQIAAVWEEYMTSFRADLWLDGSEDMIRHNLYNFGEHYTFSIRKLTDEVYEINTMCWYRFADDRDMYIYCIYKVCAVLCGGQYRLLNYFDVRKQALNRYEIGDIDYYYSAGVDFSKQDAVFAALFVTDFKKQYGIENDGMITYIVAGSIDECSSILGLTYTELRSEKVYAGRTIYPRTVLSARPNHIHELVHAVMLPLYPDAPSIFHEGIATLYGGGGNKSFDFHAANLKKYLSENRIDLSEEVYLQLDGETSLYNTLGALIIEYVLKSYGTGMVLSLFESETYKDIFFRLGIHKEGINDFIYDTLINR